MSRDRCVCCSGGLRPFAQARILKRHLIDYYQCTNCGFTCTEQPFWLDEAYAEAITASDVGLVSRNQTMTALTMLVISAFFRRKGRFLDYGAGYGLLVRMLRDQGFDCAWYDPYCANLFAQSAPADLSGQTRYELLTAFELFEHLPDPAETLTQMRRLSEHILFTTELIPHHNPYPQAWWYYGLDHGQHVALYTEKALRALASRYGCHLYTNGVNLHLLTTKRLAPLSFRLVTQGRLAVLLKPLLRQRSLIAADYQRITGRELR